MAKTDVATAVPPWQMSASIAKHTTSPGLEKTFTDC